jgi:hypothetical protein
MSDKVVLIPMNEEEIKKLPFPETARLLGGILVIKSDPIPEEDLEKIRFQFNECIRGSK